MRPMPKLTAARLPKDHLACLARSPEMRKARPKVQKEYMTYRRAMIERDSVPMGFMEWRKS